MMDAETTITRLANAENAEERAELAEQALRAVAALRRDVESLKDCLTRMVHVARDAEERTAQIFESIRNVARHARDELDAVDHLGQIRGQVSDDVADAVALLRSTAVRHTI